MSKQTPIPIIFHNLKGYDVHYIIGSIYNVKNVKVSGVIAQSGEKYKTFVLREKKNKTNKRNAKIRTRWKTLDLSDLSYRDIQKWVKKFKDEKKISKDTKLNKKKDELEKLLVPFEEEILRSPEGVLTYP